MIITSIQIKTYLKNFETKASKFPENLEEVLPQYYSNILHAYICKRIKYITNLIYKYEKTINHFMAGYIQLCG